MWEYIPACRWREEEFSFETELVKIDKNGDRVMSLIAPDECHSCQLKSHCVREALNGLSWWKIDEILDIKMTWAHLM